ncbi:XdhC family protein [Burkholderia cenocepacia]|nr:XdhC family protein [Burkholderia cenocepacia]
MEDPDLTVLKRLQQWRRSGHRCLLVTVTRTWGSSPRPVGSIMALSEDGAVAGSVSGGCIEGDLISRYSTGESASWPTGKPVQLVYGLTADEAHRFGLPCGGTLELVVEPDPCSDDLATLILLIEQGVLVERHLNLDDGSASLVWPASGEDVVSKPGRLSRVFGPSYRMLLIGATQLTGYVTAIALTCGFSVTICDPRPEYLGAIPLDNARVTTAMPDDAVRAFRPDARTCVIALTHDPKLDDMALLEALDSRAFYVGAIGSRRNAALRCDRMIAYLDMTEAALSRLHSPVGLFIGSRTPAEIAVSVMAEVLAARSQVPIHPAQTIAHAKNLTGVLSV